MRVKKWWYSNKDLVGILAYTFAWPAVPAVVAALAGWNVPTFALAGVGALFIPGMPIAGKLMDRPSFLRYVRDDQGCYVSPVQAGWQLTQAYETRDGFPGRDHARYAAALVPGDNDGITRLVIGCWSPDKRLPYIYHQEQIKVADDLTDQLRDHIASRLVDLRHEAHILENDSFDRIPERLSDRTVAKIEQASARQRERTAQHIQRQLATLQP